MDNWYSIREQSAGKWRIRFLWGVYRVFGLRALKVIIWFVVGFITMCAAKPRGASRKYKKILQQYERKNNIKLSRFSSFGHILCFANSVIDKMAVICDKKTKIHFDFYKNPDFTEVQKLFEQNKGVFFICSHLGNTEALSGVPTKSKKRMHAFMNVGQNPIFRSFITQHAKYDNTIIYPTENIDVAMAGKMHDALCNGDCVMMAGDRRSPNAPDKTIVTEILGTRCELPAGVFRFARALTHPVFAIANINIGPEKYMIFVKRLGTENINVMAQEYADFLQDLIIKYPKQWFNFFDFFQK